MSWVLTACSFFELHNLRPSGGVVEVAALGLRRTAIMMPEQAVDGPGASSEHCRDYQIAGAMRSGQAEGCEPCQKRRQNDHIDRGLPAADHEQTVSPRVQAPQPQ